MTYIRTAAVLLAILLVFAIAAMVSPTGRRAWNMWRADIQVASDETDYQTRKNVEDSCRAMIATYESDRLMYEQYREGEGEEIEWAQQAKTRANRTAATYNNFVLKNEFVWKENIPPDIKKELDYLD